jgi:glycosyl transferase family 25
MLTVEINGGLGNQLFQMAFLEYLYKNTNIPIQVVEWNMMDKSPHATHITYLNSIFSYWRKFISLSNKTNLTIYEENLNPKNWIEYAKSGYNNFVGYFQNYNYITDDFISKLTFSNTILLKYPNIEDTVFIHIRGGDYLKQNIKDVHYIELSNYYETSINKFPRGTKFSIFTNDLTYLNTLRFINSIDYEIINEDEIDSLYLMSKCKGGICANSSFSWWGAYLNKARKIIIPSKWFNRTDIICYNSDGLYVPEWEIVDVKAWDFIEKVVYINLDYRTDRNENMKRVLNVFDSDKVIRFSGIKHSPGNIGCLKSHIAVLKMALDHKWKNVLILEDDVEWNKYTQGYNRLLQLIRNNYDVIMLGGGSAVFDEPSSKLYSAQCASSYLVNSEYIPTLLEKFQYGLNRLIETGNAYEYMHDMVWKTLQAKDNWYFIHPCLMYQTPGYSDLECKVVDYTAGMHLNTTNNIENTGQVKVDSQFGRWIIKYASDKRFKRYLEIGTWNGRGSTCCFYEGFKYRTDSDYMLQSYEINSSRANEAKDVWKFYPHIDVIHGSIMKINEYPSLEDIQKIHPELNMEWYIDDINSLKTCDVIPMIDPEVVCLDGSEYLTYFEFQKIMRDTNAKVYILDDTIVSKCIKIVEWFKNHNDEWKCIDYSDSERNGWCIFEKL